MTFNRDAILEQLSVDNLKSIKALLQWFKGRYCPLYLNFYRQYYAEILTLRADAGGCLT